MKKPTNPVFWPCVSFFPRYFGKEIPLGWSNSRNMPFDCTSMEWGRALPLQNGYFPYPFHEKIKRLCRSRMTFNHEWTRKRSFSTDFIVLEKNEMAREGVPPWAVSRGMPEVNCSFPSRSLAGSFHANADESWGSGGIDPMGGRGSMKFLRCGDVGSTSLVGFGSRGLVV